MEEILHQVDAYIIVYPIHYIQKTFIHPNGGCFEFWISEPSTVFIGGECDEVSIPVRLKRLLVVNLFRQELCTEPPHHLGSVFWNGILEFSMDKDGFPDGIIPLPSMGLVCLTYIYH